VQWERTCGGPAPRRQTPGPAPWRRSPSCRSAARRCVPGPAHQPRAHSGVMTNACRIAGWNVGDARSACPAAAYPCRCYCWPLQSCSDRATHVRQRVPLHCERCGVQALQMEVVACQQPISSACALPSRCRQLRCSCLRFDLPLVGLVAAAEALLSPLAPYNDVTWHHHQLQRAQQC